MNNPNVISLLRAGSGQAYNYYRVPLPLKVGPINVELFCCAGGMAEGFRRAGILFDIAVDVERDHCDSYERNLGHRPIAMDVRDLVRLVRAGWRADIDLVVADPPCSPWSRGGKREGVDDDRDMLEETCELIATLKPRRYLIGNVPGLDDEPNLRTVQRVIGGLSAVGYCTADYARLDAADYGVPQNRIRPFWFGHLEGPCLRWPAPTHTDPRKLHTLALPTMTPLRRWVTCRDALGHLEGDDLGRPVKLRARAAGNRHDEPERMSNADRPARTVTTMTRSAGHATTIVLNPRHLPAVLDAPAPTMGAKPRSQGAQVLTWPWDRPSTTLQCDERLPPPGHHPLEWRTRSSPDAIVLTERAAALLQGFPDTWVFAGSSKRARWSQLGQAMPPELAAAVARSIVEQGARGGA